MIDPTYHNTLISFESCDSGQFRLGANIFTGVSTQTLLSFVSRSIKARCVGRRGVVARLECCPISRTSPHAIDPCDEASCKAACRFARH